jgi:transcriptional regulator with XRE-family HTH domain
VQSRSVDAAYRRAVGKRIRVWRVLNERSQDELAAEAGVTRNFVSAIERGAQGLDAVRLRRLALAMDMSLGELLADPEPAGSATLSGGSAPSGPAPGDRTGRPGRR